MNPKIISLGFAVPEKSYSQEEVFQALGYPSRFRRIFLAAGIDKRHFWLPLGGNRSWQEMCVEYKKGATALSIEATAQCLDGRDPKTIDFLSYVSCTGYQCPSMNYVIAKEMGFRNDIEQISLVGDGGCAGAGPAIKQAYNFVKQGYGRLSLVVACEVCSVCYFPENPNPDPRGKYQLLRSNAIFGDGCAAALIGVDDDYHHPSIIDARSYTDYENQYALGFEWRDGRLSCVLSADVPDLAPKPIKLALDPLLTKHSITVSDIKWLICHPGGKKVLDRVQDVIGFTKEQMFFSRDTLRQYGNMSSASVGVLGKIFTSSQNNDIQKGDWGIIITVGSGMNAWVILLRFV